MSKKTYTCPICHVQVKDLKGHTARMHPEKAKPEPKSQPKSTGKTLELAVKTKPKKETEETKYHCVNCGYKPLTKGQTPCPGCGATLDWSQV